MRCLQRLESAKGTHGRPDVLGTSTGIVRQQVVRQQHEAVKISDMWALRLVDDLELRKEATVRQPKLKCERGIK